MVTLACCCTCGWRAAKNKLDKTISSLKMVFQKTIFLLTIFAYLSVAVLSFYYLH